MPGGTAHIGDPRRGRVAAFDSDRGIGEVEDDSGGRWPFHCTAISDGSRTIEPGTAVAFEVMAGRLGRWEATAVSPT